ncbi:MAG: undecaprenyldiphospho-muramoylpentapeptide beta-N-acetylglucosaminyltransferase [Magnetococcales bacterium]|nr:undecaprenyldiphospho-muramoylpentapeptide beta-N-acetylglucosaminyltransferase [Magnetococcales bacterium]
MTTEGKRLLIAGGGTGGHLFPALAVATYWEELGGETLFVGTAEGMEATILPARGKHLETLNVGRLKGVGALGRIRTILGLPLAIWQAYRILRRFEPQVVLGVGGYASAPAMFAARLMGIPTALHEQNAVPGLTNRWLGRWVDQILLGFPEATARFSGRQVQVTGNPVRDSLLTEAEKMEGTVQIQAFNDTRPLSILIFGGSQGAQIFADVVPGALESLKKGGHAFEVMHQARPINVEPLKRLYSKMHIEAEVTPFIDDMAAAYRKADLVICRSGAGTISELTVMGKAALLVPYPYAADDHQTANAAFLIDKGGGWVRNQDAFTSHWLARFLKTVVSDPARVIKAGKNAGSLARPTSARKIVDRLVALTNRNEIDDEDE